MGLLSSFLDKHYPHEQVVKQRKKQKGISVSASGEVLPLKSILEVLLNKAMRADAYVTVDEQVMVMVMVMVMVLVMLTVFVCVYLCVCACAQLTPDAFVGSSGTGTWSC